jgi:membrane protein implicated in regulation of membrane protease activity
VFAVLVSVGMSFFMSFALALVNVGLVPNFLTIWLVGYAVSFLVSLPISLILIPVIKKTVDKLTAE